MEQDQQNIILISGIGSYLNVEYLIRQNGLCRRFFVDIK